MIDYIPIVNGGVDAVVGRNVFEKWSGDTPESVRERVCNETIWSMQTDVVDEASKYFEELCLAGLCFQESAGFLCGVACIVVWLGFCAKEFFYTVEFLSLLMLPRPTKDSSRHSNRRKAKGEDDYWAWGTQYVDSLRGTQVRRHIRALDPCCKVIVCIVGLLRLSIVCVLAYYGAKFLTYTTSVRDFVLNSVSLVFVFELDKLAFQVLVSKKKQQVLQDLRPTPLRDILTAPASQSPVSNSPAPTLETSVDRWKEWVHGWQDFDWKSTLGEEGDLDWTVELWRCVLIGFFAYLFVCENDLMFTSDGDFRMSLQSFRTYYREEFHNKICVGNIFSNSSQGNGSV